MVCVIGASIEFQAGFFFLRFPCEIVLDALSSSSDSVTLINDIENVFCREREKKQPFSLSITFRIKITN